MPSSDLLTASRYLDEPTPAETQTGTQSFMSAVSPIAEDDPIRRPARENLPTSLNIAGFDTGIEIGEGLSAALVGMGDGLLDTWHGLTQIFGKAELLPELQSDQNLVNDLYNDPRIGKKARGGQVAGFFADPVGVLVPIGKGKNLWDVTKVGMATGATFGSLGYVDEQAGQTRMGNALIGTVTGGVLSPTLFGATRAVKGVGAQIQERAATKLLDTYKKEFNRHIASGHTPTQASYFSMQKMGWTAEDKAGLIMASGKPFSIDQSSFKVTQAEANLRAMNSRLITKTSTFLDKYGVGRDAKKALGSLASGFKDAIVPISTRIMQKDRQLGVELISMEARIKKAQHNFHIEVQGFIKGLRTIEKAGKMTELKGYLANGNLSDARRLWNTEFKYSPQAMRDFDKMRGVLKTMYDEANNVGYLLPQVKNYYPRRISDLEGLSQVENSKMSEALRIFREKKARDPSDKEIDRMVRDILNPREFESFKTGGSLRNRNKEIVSDDELAFYHDPEATLVSYINDMVTDIERARFLTKIGAVRPKEGYALDGTDLMGEKDILNQTLAARQKQGRYHAGDIEELSSLLRSRFTKGELAPSAAVQAFKNSTYIATLGNFKSALTQLGDLAFSAHRNGIVNTSLELMNRIPGLRKIVKGSHTRVTKEQVGLEDAIQEFAGDRNGKKALDWFLTKTGFKAMDRLGKETFVNAHFRQIKKLLNNPKFAAQERMRLRNKWNPVFGAETDQMINDLANGRFTDNVQVYLFDSLSQVQPISLSEMPKAYLDHPNGRLFYMLRSFTIKQLDLMRRDILDNLAKGDAPTAFRNLTSLGTTFVLANGSADMLKDFMTGKEIEMEDTIVDNIWKLSGINRYTGDRILSGTPGAGAVDLLAPPFSVWDRLIRSAGDSQKMWEASPFNGLQIFEQMINDGELTRTKSDDYYSKLGAFHDVNDK